VKNAAPRPGHKANTQAKGGLVEIQNFYQHLVGGNGVLRAASFSRS
jgi:hypothetical protein